MPKLLNIIVACAENRVIGRGGKVPWRIPEDLKFFHDETAGKVCVLGRVGFETWPRATLDGRRPVVLTSHPLARSASSGPRAGRGAGAHGHDIVEGSRERVEFAPIPVRSLPEALTVAESLPGEICICGGQRIYEETLALQRPMRLHLTLIHATIAGDTYFPEWRHLPWREIARRESAEANYRYTFFTLEVFAPQKP